MLLVLLRLIFPDNLGPPSRAIRFRLVFRTCEDDEAVIVAERALQFRMCPKTPQASLSDKPQPRECPRESFIIASGSAKLGQSFKFSPSFYFYPSRCKQAEPVANGHSLVTHILRPNRFHLPQLSILGVGFAAI